MARWRGKKRQKRIATIGIAGAVFFLFLAWLTTQIPWESVSFVVLVIILLGFGGYSINQLIRVIKFQIAQSAKFDRASRIRTTHQMGFLTDFEFEHYVATLYEGLGFSATVTKRSGDGGIDVVLRNREGTAAVQVKQFGPNNRVGRPDIQKLVGASSRDFDKMIFVTTSDFTQQARDEAVKHGVVLVDGESLVAMAKKVFGINHEQKTFSFRFLRKMESQI